MSRNLKHDYKPSKTINFKPDFKSLFRETTLTETDSNKKEKIRRLTSEKINTDNLNIKKLNKEVTINLPRVKQPQIMRTVYYKKYFPLTTIYAEIDRSKKEIDSYIKEGKKICLSLEKNRNHTESNLLFSPSNFHSKSKTLLTQSTFFESPRLQKKKNIFSNNDILSDRKNIINLNNSSKKILLKKIENNLNDNYDEHESRRTSISSRAKYQTIEVNKGREKSYVVSYIPRWHFKNQLINIKASKEVIESLDFQKNIFSDEILILLDNLSDYKKKFIMDEGLCYYFYNTSLKNQRTLNKLLEETIGLMIEICYLLLNEYSNELDKFIANIQERPNVNDDKFVENENEEFKINIKKFVDCSNFVKVCFDCYENILLYDKECLLKAKQFYKIMQFLQRARLNTGELKYMTENLFNNFNKDDKIVNKFMNDMKEYRNKKKFKNIPNTKKKISNNYDFYNYKGPVILKETQELNKIKRLNIALDKDFSQNKQNYHPKHLNFNSRLVNGLLKYATKNFRAQILSERIIQRFKEKEREENLNLDID